MKEDDIIIKGDGLRTIKDLMKERGFSNNLIEELAKSKGIHQRGVPVKATDVSGENTTIVLSFPREKHFYKEVDLDLSVLFEDEDLIAIDKPPFLTMHSESQEISLANGVSHLFKQRGINRKIRFINRLDRDTSGVVFVAKNPLAQHLFQLNRENCNQKKYLLIVEGVGLDCEGIIDINLSQDLNTKRYVRSALGKRSITRYKVISQSESYTMVEASLDTGRTHQIRASFYAIGFTVLGDRLYGSTTHKIDRQALHAYMYSTFSIRNSQIIRVTAPIPKEFMHIIRSA